jgi:hypothetical protein
VHTCTWRFEIILWWTYFLDCVVFIMPLIIAMIHRSE